MALSITVGCVALLCIGLVLLDEWGDSQETREREERANRALGACIGYIDPPK